MTITIRNARFSYAGLRQPTLEELHDGRHSISITIPNPPHVQAAYALAFGYDPTRFLVGHDPQKLLPSPERLAREWREAMVRAFDFPQSWLDEDLFVRPYIPILPPGEEIRMTPLPTPFVPRWGDERTPAEDLETATQAMMRERTRTYEHKIAVVKAPDMTDALMLQLQAREDIRAIVIDIESASGHLGSALRDTDIMGRFREASDNAQLRLYALGAMFGEPYMPRLDEIKPKIVSTSAGKRDMGYLAHDPSKKHKRRKRR